MPHLIGKLHDAETTPTFVRSFAYASGPAWGTLLEMKQRHLAGLIELAEQDKPPAAA